MRPLLASVSVFVHCERALWYTAILPVRWLLQVGEVAPSLGKDTLNYVWNTVSLAKSLAKEKQKL